MNIIELAKKANIYASHQTDDAHDWPLIRDEHFADLVLEEAAVECDKRAHAGDAGVLMAARAIRALKGAKE